MVLFPPALTVRLQTLEPRIAVRISVSQPNIRLYEQMKAKLTGPLPGIGANRALPAAFQVLLRPTRRSLTSLHSGQIQAFSGGFLVIL